MKHSFKARIAAFLFSTFVTFVLIHSIAAYAFAVVAA
jgi:hypothetical protein